MSTAQQRIYEVAQKEPKQDGEKAVFVTTLVKASTQAQALRFVARDKFAVEVASAVRVAELMADGAKVLDATAEEVES